MEQQEQKKTGPQTGAPGGRLLSVERPGTYACVAWRHLPWAAGAAAVLLAAMFFPFEKVPLRICVFRLATGYPCITCGYTRGVVSVAQGRIAETVRDCPAAVPAYAAIACVFAWNAAALLCGRKLGLGRWLRPGPVAVRCIIAAAALIVLANWIYRLLMGFK